MAFFLLIAFITVPIVEIAVFIQVGDWIGLWPTLAVVILTAVAGTALLRQQGLSILFRIQENLEANRVPVRELFDGVCLVIAGALLLTPGFVTDTIGFVLFVPPARAAIAAWIAARMVARADVRFHTTQSGPRPGPGGGPVIDGEFEDISDPTRDTPDETRRPLPKSPPLDP